MIRNLFAAALAFAVSTSALAAESYKEARKIPPPPPYYVFDEPHVLSDRANQALQALLVEHDRTTGEQVLVAVFNSLEGEDLNDYVNRIFQAWKIGQRGKDNGALLALFMKEHQARIEVGYGLEPLLTDLKSSRILKDVLVPALREGHPDDGVTAAAYEILSVIQSPLIQSGRALQILRSGGYGSRRPTPAHALIHPVPLQTLGLILFFSFCSYEALSDRTKLTSPEMDGIDPALGSVVGKIRRNGPRAAAEGGVEASVGVGAVVSAAAAVAEVFPEAAEPLAVEARVRAGKVSRIVQAIAEAKSHTGGEIRVHLSHRWLERDTMARAEKLFHRFELHHPRHGACILLYVNLHRKKFALFGGGGVHAAFGQQAWDQLARKIAQDMRSTHYENAIALAVRQIGEKMAQHFPKV